jgi:hypothetical protein
MVRRHAARLVVLICFFVSQVAACGASSRTKALRGSLVALNTARDAVLALSKEREKQIYASCNPPTCTKEDGHARVFAWQKKVDVAIKAIDVGYRAVHDAALLDDTKSAIDASAAAANALDFYKRLKETKEKP